MDENVKYYVIAKSIYDRYIETDEYVNVFDFVNHYDLDTLDNTEVETDIVSSHIANMTYLYYDEFRLDDNEWDLVIREFSKMFEDEK